MAAAVLGGVFLGAGACTVAKPAMHNYDDNSVTYHGQWQTGGIADAHKYGGNDHYSVTRGASFSVRFLGTGIQLFTARGSWHGLTTISIDGHRASNFDEYSAHRIYGSKIFDSRTLTNGTHTLTLTVSGSKSARSTGTTVAIDRVAVAGTILPLAPAPIVPPAPVTRATGFVQRSGTNLLLSGRKFRFTGLDSFVMMGCGYSYENLNDNARNAFFAGLRPNSVVRAWLFPGSNLSAADKIVASARKYNQRVVFTLTDAVGGCGDSVKDASWYASGYKGTYLNWIRTAVPHFANNPTIAFWELINEPNSVDTRTLRAFFNAAGGLVHSLDRHHLVSSGTQPAWAYGGEAGYQYVNASPGIDIMSMHEYDQSYAASPHLAAALTAAIANNKPLFVGEYGVVASPRGDSSYSTGNGGTCVSFTTRAAMVTAKLRSYLSHPQVAGALYWSYKANHHTGCDLDSFPGDPLLRAINGVPLR